MFRMTTRHGAFPSFNRAGFADALAEDVSPDGIGKDVILSSSFVHSPRWHYQLYLDAMAMVQACGMPSYFITLCVLLVTLLCVL